VYIHWPYCKKHCHYCNFNKVVQQLVDHDRMTECMIRAVKGLLQLGHVKTVKSIYFGGGTPSLCKPDNIQRMISAISQCATLGDDIEITMEANPTSTEMEKMGHFKQAGINRLSLGIQALNDKDLQILGRDHDAAQAKQAIDIAKAHFPKRTSIDLIFARPNQTIPEWSTELEKAISMCDNHVSLYQLTLERGTKLHKQVQQQSLHLPDEDIIAQMYENAINTMRRYGYQRYEVSNFAKQGAISQHNLSYWTSNDYIGVGPGAHGRLIIPSLEYQRYAMIQCLSPNHWMTMVEQGKLGIQKMQKQSEMERLTELILLGMRTPAGISRKRWDSIASPKLEFNKVF
ncbi:uncharacterized protein TRIADDRAFT_13916, partial [Trichoplax adhaerens]